MNILSASLYSCGIQLSETLAKIFIMPARQKQFMQENNAPVRGIAIAMNTNPAFTGPYTEKPFWYQQFGLRQFRVLRGGQTIVHFVAANIFCLHVTTMKAMNFHDDITSIPIDKFKDQYVLVSGLTPLQDATENCHRLVLVGEPLKLELNFTFPPEHVTELILLWERESSVELDKFGVVGNSLKEHFSSPAKNQLYRVTQVPVPWLISFWLCSYSWQWHFCHYQYGN